MNTYRAAVNLVVEVHAFDESDAKDVISEHFGTGEDSTVEVVDCEIGDFEQVD